MVFEVKTTALAASKYIYRGLVDLLNPVQVDPKDLVTFIFPFDHPPKTISLALDSSVIVQCSPSSRLNLISHLNFDYQSLLEKKFKWGVEMTALLLLCRDLSPDDKSMVSIDTETEFVSRILGMIEYQESRKKRRITTLEFEYAREIVSVVKREMGNKYGIPKAKVQESSNDCASNQPIREQVNRKRLENAVDEYMTLNGIPADKDWEDSAHEPSPPTFPRKIEESTVGVPQRNHEMLFATSFPQYGIKMKSDLDKVISDYENQKRGPSSEERDAHVKRVIEDMFGRILGSLKNTTNLHEAHVQWVMIKEFDDEETRTYIIDGLKWILQSDKPYFKFTVSSELVHGTGRIIIVKFKKSE